MIEPAAATRVREIFLEAIERSPPGGWPQFLCNACQGDDALRRQVERLLAAHVGDDSFMAQPAAVWPARETPANERVGGRIGRYQLLEQIGQGGMGVVFLAEQTEPVRRLVALKIIKPGMDSRQVIARFEAERQALALMDHPNIAKFLDAGTTGETRNGDVSPGRPYFVMELVRGAPITDYCDQARLIPGQRLELFIAVCRAVQHAHQRGIIHRDLKPSNVLVAQLDGLPIVKVIDFGVAKAVGPQPTDCTTYAAFSQVIGTPLYMSPEQAELSGAEVDTRSDVYSLGVLLYELLTGQTPIDKETLNKAGLDELRRMVREDEPPRPSHCVSTLGLTAETTVCRQRGLEARRLKQVLRGELDWIVMKALEKDRQRRYEAAGALAADAQRYLDDQPIQARPTSWPRRAAKWRRRHPVWVVASVAGMLLLASLVVGGLWHSYRVEQSDRQSKQLREEGLTRELALTNLSREYYETDIRLTWQALKTENFDEARRLLDRHRPITGKPDYTGFEWRYLRTLAQGPLATLIGHRHAVLAVDVSPDDQFVASGDRGGEIKVFRLDSRQPVTSLQPADKEVTSIRFSPDGKILATAGQDQWVRLWSVEDWRQIALLEQHEATICGIAWSPDGQWIASAGRDRNVHIWNVAARRVEHSLPLHDDVVRAVAWSPDGNLLATTDGGKGVRLWETATWRQRGLLPANDDALLCLAFTPDSRYLATGGYIAILQVFDTLGLTEVARADIQQQIWALAFLNTHDLVVGTKEAGPVTCRFDTLENKLAIVHKRTGAPGTLRGVVPANHGAMLVVASEEEKSLVLWDSATLLGYRPTLLRDSVGVMPKRRLVLTANENGTMSIKRLSDASEVAAFTRYNSGGFHPAISRAEDLLAIPRHNGLNIFSTATWKRVRRFNSPNGAGKFYSVQFSQDSRWIAYGCWNGFVGATNLKTGESRTLLVRDTKWPGIVGFLPRSNLLAYTVFGHTTVAIWDLDRNERVDELTIREQIIAMCFTPDGRKVVLSHGNYSMSLWDATAGVKVGTMHGHTELPEILEVSPDGKTLVSWAKDNTVRLWSLATCRELFPIQENADVSWIKFLSDGSLIIAANPNSAPAIFPGVIPAVP